MGLPKRSIPIPLIGGLDTKTASQLVPLGSFLELENCFREKTGELRKRYGSAVLTAISFAGQLGNPTLARFGNGLVRLCQTLSTNPTFPMFAYDPGPAKWLRVPSYYAGSSLTPRVLAMLATDQDATDPDCAYASGAALVASEQPNGVVDVAIVDVVAGTHIARTTILSAVRPRAAAALTYLCVFYVDTTASPPSLKCAVYDQAAANPASPITYTLMSGTVTTSEPHFDVRKRDGASTIIVACRNNSGTITGIEFNPATGASVASGTFAADATMCLGWLEDQFSSGSYYLATAGATDGVRVRHVSTAFAVTATQTMDGTATTNVRNVTGYLTTVGGNKRVFWEVNASPTYNSLIRVAVWTGAAAVSVWQRASCLLSKPYLYRGVYMLNTAYDSQNQPVLMACRADMTWTILATVEAVAFQGESGGRTAKQGILSSVPLVSTGNFITAATKRVTTEAENGTFLSTRNAVALELRFDEAAMGLPVELGGNLYIPGGRLKVYDGAVLMDACCLVAPEVPTGSVGTIGSLTPSSTYRWLATYAQPSASGRLYRSAPSDQLELALGASDDSASIDVPMPRLVARDIAVGGNVLVELWRTEAGGTVFYLHSRKASSFGADTTNFVDTLADSSLRDNEILYTTGGILENFDAPAFTSIVAYRNRLWGISAEDRTAIWYSKELKPGTGVAFRADQTVRVSGPDGDAFGLAVMDDKLVILKASAIYALVGDGPDDRGQGGYDTPTLITGQQGSINPRSLVLTPDGLMFEGSRGIWLLDRALVLRYIGAPVEAYTTSSSDVTGAVHLPHQHQVRFFTSGGRTLVWDYLQQQWYTFTGQQAGAALAIGSTIYWCHPTSDTVSYETEGAYGDNGAGYQQRIGLPFLVMAGILGFQRLYKLQLLGEAAGSHTLAVDFQFDYSGVTAYTAALASAAAWPRCEVPFPRQRCTAAKLVIYESAANTGAGFRLVAASLLAGIKPGLSRIPSTSRLT